MHTSKRRVTVQVFVYVEGIRCDAWEREGLGLTLYKWYATARQTTPKKNLTSELSAAGATDATFRVEATCRSSHHRAPWGPSQWDASSPSNRVSMTRAPCGDTHTSSVRGWRGVSGAHVALVGGAPRAFRRWHERLVIVAATATTRVALCWRFAMATLAPMCWSGMVAMLIVIICYAVTRVVVVTSVQRRGGVAAIVAVIVVRGTSWGVGSNIVFISLVKVVPVRDLTLRHGLTFFGIRSDSVKQKKSNS